MVDVGGKATADFANARPRVLNGTASPNVTTAGTAAFVDVTFPAGYFPAGVTNAQVSIAISTTQPQAFSCSYQNLTATGMRIYANRTAGTGAIPVSYTVFGPES